MNKKDILTNLEALHRAIGMLIEDIKKSEKPR